MDGSRKYTSITQLDVLNILRNLDRGASIAFISKKYTIANRIVAEIKVTRQIPIDGKSPSIEKIRVFDFRKYTKDKM